MSAQRAVFASDWDLIERRPWRPPLAPTVVVAPHPDDEVLGCGGLIHRQRNAGVRVTVIAVTDGEAAELTVGSPSAIGPIRRGEQEQALSELGVDRADVVRLGLPDGALATCESALVEHLVGHVGPADLLVAPDVCDFHPDHEACARAASTVAAIVGCRLVTTLVWAPVRRDPPDHPQPLLSLRLDRNTVRRRLAAIQHHRTQIAPRRGRPIVQGELLVRLASPFELFGAAAG